MSITASQVNELRQRTGISMMQCKKALEEAKGNEEKAIEILRKKGAAKAAEKADRAMKQGIVIAEVKGNKAVLVKLLCETDFVSRNPEFIAIANAAAAEALKKGAAAAEKTQGAVLKELFTRLGENMSLDGTNNLRLGGARLQGSRGVERVQLEDVAVSLAWRRARAVVAHCTEVVDPLFGTVRQGVTFDHTFR